METFSALLAICAENSPVPGEFPAQRPVTRSFDVFSDLRSNKRLGKQSWGWWSETPSSSLWCHRNDSRGSKPISWLLISCLLAVLCPLRWLHNGRDGVSNHQPHEYLLNRFFERRSKKSSQLRVTGLYAGNSTVTAEFPAPKASNAEMFIFDDVIIIFDDVIMHHQLCYSGPLKVQKCKFPLKLFLIERAISLTPWPRVLV